MILRNNFLLGLFPIIFLIGCETNEGNNQSTSRKFEEFLAANPIQQAAFQCHSIKAVIPKGGAATGNKCDENFAVVNGWSEKCVQNGKCDNKARLSEVNQAAEGFCKNWCDKKGCDYDYTKRAQCSSDWCSKSSECKINCKLPLMDACFFQEMDPDYNCECKDKVEG